VRGGTEHVTEEAQRTIEDAIGATSVASDDGAVLPGAGAPETELALHLREYAGETDGREQLAVEALANALEVVPRTLAENAGQDAKQTLVDLPSEHQAGNTAPASTSRAVAWPTWPTTTSSSPAA
jgi:chaperonin GroEL (HSP60 family)